MVSTSAKRFVLQIRRIEAFMTFSAQQIPGDIIPVCEICGAEAERLSRVKLEGTVLEACKNCASLGEVLPQAPHSLAARPAALPKKIDMSEFVVPGFGGMVKSARERQKLEFRALAEKLQIKEPLLHRVEQGRLVPDLGLAKKIERALGIKLVERIED